MSKLNEIIESKIQELREYSNKPGFDLYDFEEKIFQEFKEIQRQTLETLTNERDELQKKR
ncbi:MAG: hypothetical protein OEV66_12165 [Spirochaetia bacterium]|nr:hypothetical protein [Spirochaetia bacterium]